MELEEPPRSTPERGAFSTPKRVASRSKKGDLDSSSASVASSDNALRPERSNSSGIRASIDRGLDKLREKGRPASIAGSFDTRGSQQAEASPGRRSKFTKLLQSRSQRKKRKGDVFASPDGSNAGERELGRGRAGIAKSGILLTAEQASPTGLQNLGNGSTDSLDASRSGRSSLLTEDSEPEQLAVRPPLVSRLSHQDYLTLSSPLVEAETINSSNLDPQPAPSSRLSQSISAPPAVELTNIEHSSPTTLARSLSAESTADIAAQQIVSSTPGSPSSSPARTGPFAGILGVLNRTETISSVGTAGSTSTISSSRAAGPGKLRLPANINSLYAKGESKSATLPSTFVTPPTPDTAQASPALPVPQTPGTTGTARQQKSSASTSSINPLGHRRVRSALAAPRGTSSPLSPAIEEAITPGGTLVQPSGSGGFLSSFFSATQNAVNTLSNAINSPPTSSSGGQRNRSGTDPDQETRARLDSTADTVGEREEVVVVTSTGDRVVPAAPVNEPAIATLGSGNLSLSHLGLPEQDSTQPSMPLTRADTPEETTMPAQPEAAATSHGTKQAYTYPTEEASSAAEAVSAAYNATAASEKAVPDYRMEMGRPFSNSTSTRPRSVGSSNGIASGEATPPRSAAAAELEGVLSHRSGSIRSRLSDRRRRNRRSSTATGSAIAAAIGASHASLGLPGGGAARRFSGFSQASSKRNKEFHQMFKSVPEDDYLIDDYSAALQRDILLHGRLYVTERHICFASNILGWSTSLVIAIDEIVALEKKSTALIFPNAIIIQTLHAKNVFASFINRDNTYDLLLALWKIVHPKIKASDNGHVLDNTQPDSGSNNGSGAADRESDVDDDEVSDDSDAEYDDASDDGATNSSLHNKPVSTAGSEAGEGAKASGMRQVSTATNTNGTTNGTASKAADASNASTGSAGAKDFPGPATHAPTECSDQDAHYDKLCLDTTIPAPLGKVYSLLFGPNSGTFMRKFLVDDQKSSELQMEDDKKGIGEDTKSFSYTFIKPLGGSIGPKQTKCIVNQTLDTFDLEKAVSVTGSTQTPDVPSGNVFVTKTKYCLTWGPSNSTRLVMNTTCEWSGKSWLKGPIEKGAAEGQEKYGSALAAYLKANLSKSSPKPAGKSGKTKGRKKRASSGGEDDGTTSPAKAGGSASEKKSGLSGTLSEVFGDVAGGFLTPTGVLATLLLVVTFLWVRGAWFSPAAGRATISLDGRSVLSPRFATYDELWQREETELWNWLEDRINLDSMTSAASSPEFKSSSSAHTRQKMLSRKSMETKLGEETMSERQLDNAVKVTEERLEALKAAIEKKRGEGVRHD